VAASPNGLEGKSPGGKKKKKVAKKKSLIAPMEEPQMEP